MIPQLLRPDADALAVCELAAKWRIAPELAYKLHALAVFLPFGISIFSGYRSPEQQQAERERPDSTAAPVHLSNHTICPARAADLRISRNDDHASDQDKLTLGRAVVQAGLRWGGGAERVNGIPIGNEWRHVDLGPRSG